MSNYFEIHTHHKIVNIPINIELNRDLFRMGMETLK